MRVPTEAYVARQEAKIAVGFGLFLLAIYLITFTGIFRSIDELALFSMAENLVQTGSLQPVLTSFAHFHNPVGPFEPGYPILATPLYWLAAQFLEVSNIHTVMLLNPMLTAATGSVLYLIGRQIHYERLACLAIAFTFGLGSMAWPYTKSFLREPAGGLLLAFAFWGVARFIDRPGWGAGALTLLPICLSAVIKASSLIALPVLTVLLGWVLYRTRRIPFRRLALAGLGALGAAIGIGLVVFAQRGYGAEGVIAQLVANPFTPEGLLPWYGLLLSPGKSLFIYSPVLILSVIAWPKFYREHSILAVGGLMLLAAMLAGLRAAQWWGGLAWGPRFLLPLFPVLVLPALTLFTRRRWPWIVLGGSAIFQALVASSNWTIGYERLFQRSTSPDATLGLDWANWAETPAFYLVRSWGRATLDMVWLYGDLNKDIKLDLGLGVGLMIVTGITGAALIAFLSGRSERIAPYVAFGAIALALPALLWRAYLDLPDYPALRGADARDLAATLSTTPFAPEQIVNVAADFGTNPWLGLIKGPARRIWLSPFQAEGFEGLLPPQPQARLALVLDNPHMWGHPPDQFQRWLNIHAYRLASSWLAGYEFYHYALGPNSGPSIRVDLRWPIGLRLTGATLPTTVTLGSPLTIDLTWQCQRDPCDVHSRAFTNLVGPADRVLSGVDGPIQYGELEKSSWSVGQPASDKRGVWIPVDALPGDYVLVIGFANEGGFIPVTLPSGDTEDYAILAHITVSQK
jgi:hypothetical protein